MAQKRRTAPTKITPEQEHKVESAVEQFQNRWGVNFNEDTTQEIISRTTEQITQPDAEIKIRPAVRNQMFAMLIEKSPEKAIKLRMNMKEKRGAEYSKAEKQRVMDTARSKGWRAARAELSSIEKRGKKTKGSKQEAKAGKHRAGRNKAAGKPKAIERPRREKEVSARETGGQKIKETIKQARSLNRLIQKKRKKYQAELKNLRMDYYADFARANPKDAEVINNPGEYTNAEVKKSGERFDKFLKSTDYYKKAGAKEERFSREIAPLKSRRDALCVGAYSELMRKKEGRIATASELKSLRDGLNTKVSAGFTDTSRRDKLNMEEARQNTAIVGRLISGLERRA